jgi:hypothetical protein
MGLSSCCFCPKGILRKAKNQRSQNSDAALGSEKGASYEIFQVLITGQAFEQ